MESKSAYLQFLPLSSVLTTAAAHMRYLAFPALQTFKRGYLLLFFLWGVNSSLVTSFPGPLVPWLVTFGHTQVCHWNFKCGAQHRTQIQHPRRGSGAMVGGGQGGGTAQPVCATAPTILPSMSIWLWWLEPKAAKFLFSISSLLPHFHFCFNSICCSLSTVFLCVLGI